MPSPELARVFELMKIETNPDAPEPSLDEQRAGYEAFADQLADCADAICTKLKIDGLDAEWIAALGTKDAPVILYLHGGGYFAGSINTHRDLCYRLSRASGGRTLAINYRLAPENPYPAAVEDALKAYRWLLSNGVDAKKLAVGGDSAGGGLTLATLLSARDAGLPMAAAAVLISPWTDLANTGESIDTKLGLDPSYAKEGLPLWAGFYLGETDPRAPLASPLYAALKGLPPTLVQVGDIELLLDDSTRFVDRARAAGVDATLELWPGMPHVWHLYASMLPEARQSIDAIGTYIRARTG